MKNGIGSSTDLSPLSIFLYPFYGFFGDPFLDGDLLYFYILVIRRGVKEKRVLEHNITLRIVL